MLLLSPPKQINSRTACVGHSRLILNLLEKIVYSSTGVVVTMKIYLVASEKKGLSFNWTRVCWQGNVFTGCLRGQLLSFSAQHCFPWLPETALLPSGAARHPRGSAGPGPCCTLCSWPKGSAHPVNCTCGLWEKDCLSMLHSLGWGPTSLSLPHGGRPPS